MADNVTLNSMTGGDNILADELTDGTLGTGKVQMIKIMDGTLDGTNKLAVDASGNITANLSATDNAALDTIDANTDYGTVISGGTETGALRVTIANNSTGVLSVDDNGGALTVDGTLTTVSTVTTVSTLTGGGVAHDGVDSGNPHKMGARATNVDITAVANNDRTDLVATLTGKQIVQPYSNPENFVSGAITTAMTGTTSTSLVAAPAAGLRNYLTTIVVSNAHASVGTDVIIQDGSGGTTLMTIPAASVYGGAVITLPIPLRQPTTATAIYCANVTTGASTKVSAVGYKAV